jgi:tRNA 2-thiouridine synthesizing protein A
MAAIMHGHRMAHTLDVRGLRCPIPLLRARAALPSLPPGETLVVLATDPEAPIDLAALAADHGLAFAASETGGEWQIVLGGGDSAAAAGISPA